MKTFNLNNLVRNAVLKMEGYASARDEFTGDTDGMIFLDANENPFENGLNRYPDSKQLTLKKTISERKGIAVDRITLGNGSDEILDFIFRVFCNPGKDNVITLPPTYGMYGVLAALNEVENREVLLTDDFQPDIPQILKTIDANTKLLLLCSPNNPTGNRISTEKITRLLEIFNGIVVLDEAYIDFASTESWLTKSSIFKNLIVIQTFSKAYGMAGIRLGMAFASPEITALLHKVKPPYNINVFTAQKGVGLCVDLSNQIDLIQKEKEDLIKVLLEVYFVEKIFPSETNFILVRVDDAALRYRQLLDNGIVVRNRSSHPRCENGLRITIGTPEENQTLIQVLKKL